MQCMARPAVRSVAPCQEEGLSGSARTDGWVEADGRWWHRRSGLNRL